MESGARSVSNELLGNVLRGLLYSLDTGEIASLLDNCFRDQTQPSMQ